MTKQQLISSDRNNTLINKHKDGKLDNLNAIEQVADDVCNVLSICGLKYYNELKGQFKDETN